MTCMRKHFGCIITIHVMTLLGMPSMSTSTNASGMNVSSWSVLKDVDGFQLDVNDSYFN